VGGARRSGSTTGSPTAWTWVCGPSTLSGPFGHVTGAVEDAGDGSARIVVLHAGRDGRLLPSHLLHQGYRIDDHLAPGIARVDEATLLAAFTGHGDDAALGLVRLRIDEGGMAETARRTVVLPGPTTYAHVLDVGDEAGRLLVITRSIGWCPTGLWVHPHTLEVSEPFLLVRHVAAAGDPGLLPGQGGRPYLVSRQLPGAALIALVPDHPSAFRNGIVVAEISSGWWRRMDGTPVRAIDDPTDWDAFAVLDQVAPPGGEWVPWVQDVSRDSAGATAVAWSERRYLPDGTAAGGLRYRVSVLRDGSWHLHPPLHAGEALYPGEPDYAAGVCFADARTTDRLWAVSSVNPRTGAGSGTRRRLYAVQLGDAAPRVRRVGLRMRDDVMRPRVSGDGVDGAHARWLLGGRYRSYKAFDTRPVVTVRRPARRRVG
jgi:hypothetical protein